MSMLLCSRLQSSHFVSGFPLRNTNDHQDSIDNLILKEKFAAASTGTCMSSTFLMLGIAKHVVLEDNDMQVLQGQC